MAEYELNDAIRFHGHRCFGLCVGVAASRYALKILGMEKSIDEELVVIAENNSCAIDAIQVIAGATAGRGNLIIKDWGKHVYIFTRREDNKSIRLSLKYDVFSKIKDRDKRIKKILESPGEDVFDLRGVEIQIPPEAEVMESIMCAGCSEPAMKSRTENIDGKIYCFQCRNEL